MVTLAAVLLAKGQSLPARAAPLPTKAPARERAIRTLAAGAEALVVALSSVPTGVVGPRAPLAVRIAAARDNAMRAALSARLARVEAEIARLRCGGLVSRPTRAALAAAGKL